MPDFKTRIPLSAYLRDPFEFAQEELLGAYLCSNVGGVFTAVATGLATHTRTS